MNYARIIIEIQSMGTHNSYLRYATNDYLLIQNFQVSYLPVRGWRLVRPGFVGGGYGGWQALRGGRWVGRRGALQRGAGRGR